jgi:hypothetical protein
MNLPLMQERTIIMARRSGTILDDLALLPWWVSVILAAAVYLSFRYLIPSISFQNPLYKGIARSLPAYALFSEGYFFSWQEYPHSMPCEKVLFHF